MDGKTVLITGGSSGLGKETAVGLASMGARVVITARDPERGEAARIDIARRSGNEHVEVLLADMASLAAIHALAAGYNAGHERLDVLINNAGAYHTHRTTTGDGFETTFGVNHLGYVLLTRLLLERLKASAPARIVNVSSRAHEGQTMDFDDLQSERGYKGMRTYGRSKLANLLFTYELARRLEGTGVTANALHPGVVATGFGKNNAGLTRTLFSILHVAGRPWIITPAEGAATSIYLASSPDVEGVSGRYFARSRERASSAASHDIEAARRLWDVSEAMLTPPSVARESA
jgi:NAD(P)-dependent dehydrogenase (short-subunit alcohol dehydrogenase family)